MAQLREDTRSVVTSSTVLSDKHNQQTERTIYYRKKAQKNKRSSRARLNQELKLTRDANASMRKAREAIAAKEIIRKEKSSVQNESCDKKFNSYVQHQSYAYNHPTNHQDSVLLRRDELIVLLKRKKYHYKICIEGDTYYVLRKGK